MGVPGRQVVIINGPGDAIAIPLWAFKLKVTPALYLSCPEQAFPAYLIGPNPIKGPVLLVGVFIIFNKKMLGGSAIGVTLGNNRVFFPFFLGNSPVVFHFPRGCIGRGVIFYVLYVFPPFQYEGFKSFITKFLSGPATRNSRANYNNIKVGS